MARINIDDDIESRNEFWRLLAVAKERFIALGMLVVFFRLAQKRYIQEQPITQDDLDAAGVSVMKETGWAVPVPGGFQALGAEAQFAWYAQKVAAGKLGGRPKKQDVVLSLNTDLEIAGKPDGLRNKPSENPLALALSPALTPATKELHVDSAAPTQPIQAGVVSHLARIWNLHCGSLPKIRDPERLNSSRARGAKNRLRERPSLEEWEEAIKRMANSPFCTGRLNRPGSHQNWRADFDFLLQPGRLDQALEGKWDPQTPAPGGGSNLFSEIQGGNDEQA